MEIAKESSISTSEKPSLWSLIVSSMEKPKNKVINMFERLKKIGKDDPRRIYHSLKVGLALTLVSIFYYVNPLFNGFGASAMWAVLTVVVVMEYTVGGTLGKGLNRAFATFLAGSLGLAAHHLAALAGEKYEPVLLSLFVFLLAAAATFSRFIPEIKARYDYGVTIFILTFSLVAVSSYRVEELVTLAQQRLSTVAIGVGICLVTTVLIFPVWAGEDLHMLISGNIEKLAQFLEGLGSEYFEEKGCENLEGKSFLRVYKSVLNSKTSEESLANFARWEPGHGNFSFRYPWRQYLKIGGLSRQCAYSIEVLANYLITVDRAPNSEFHKNIRSICSEMSSESAKALTDLACSMRDMTSPSAATLHLANALAAAGKLKTAVPEGGAVHCDVIRSAITASLLAQVVKCIHQIAGSVDELARVARFKKPEPEPEPEPESEPEPEIKVKLEGSSHVVIDVKQ